MLTLRRMMPSVLLPIGFLGLAVHGLILGFLDIRAAAGTPLGLIAPAVNLTGGLACLLASYGIWKARRWGWWLGSIYSSILPGMLLFGIIVRAYLLQSMPNLKPQTLRMHLIYPWEIFWILLFIGFIILLFQTATMDRFEGLSRNAKRLACIVGAIGFGTPILLSGVVMTVTPMLMRNLDGRWGGLPKTELFGEGIENPHSMVLSPDGSTLAVEDLSNSNGLTLLDIPSGKSRRCQLPGRPFHYCWSLDSRMIAADCGSDAGIAMIDAGTGKVFKTLNVCSHRLAFHPDGSLWNLDYRDNTLWRIDTHTWSSRSLIERCSPVQDFVISPDGKQILLAWGDYHKINPRILDPESGKMMDPWLGGDDPYIQGMKFSPDGRRLFTAHGYPAKQGRLKVWNAKTGQVEYEIPNLHSSNCDFEHFDLSPDGGFLSARDQENRPVIWSLDDRRWIWKAPGSALDLALAPSIFGPHGRELWTGAGFEFRRDHRFGIRRWTFRP